MKPLRPPIVVLIFAAMLACVGLRSNAAVNPEPAPSAIVFAIPSEIQPTDNAGGDSLGKNAAIVPEFLSPERFADEVSSSTSTFVLEQIKRTRSLDDCKRSASGQACLAGHWQLAFDHCQQELQLPLTLSSLHVRLQV